MSRPASTQVNLILQSKLLNERHSATQTTRSKKKLVGCQTWISFDKSELIPEPRDSLMRQPSISSESLSSVSAVGKKHVKTQCALGLLFKSISDTSDAISQTRVQSLEAISQTDVLSAEIGCQVTLFDPVENEIWYSHVVGCKVLRQIASLCLERQLSIKFCTNIRQEKLLIVTQPLNIGLLDEDVQIVEVQITENGKCSIIIPFREVQVKQLFIANIGMEPMFMANLEEILGMVAGNDYTYCPGITKIAKFPSFMSENFEKFNVPFPRLQSISCQVWFKSVRKRKKVICEHCQRGSRAVYTYNKRKAAETPEQLENMAKRNYYFPDREFSRDNLKRRLEIVDRARKSLLSRVAQLESQLKTLNPVENASDNNDSNG